MAPDDDAVRVTLAIGAFWGGVFWGLYHLATTFLAGQPVQRKDVLFAVANVAGAAAMGCMVAWYVGPSIGGLIPIESLRDPHPLGFGIGAFAWELAPFAYKWARLFADRKTGGGAQ